MLNAQTRQFKLADDGQILYQPNPSNPLPGAPVAVLRKGPAALDPVIEILESCPAEARAGAPEFLKTWLATHIAGTLEPLMALKSDESLQGPVREIADAVFESMGTLPRERIERVIEKLDPELRRALRGKKIRLGPILVFQPDLNKPAAVHLRALLWSLYHGKSLPAPVPPDGAVSFKIDPATANPEFYQAVGYPVFGPRAIRIDMLDRVINAIYDSAKGGQFLAQHQMAEWLGCSIEDLYAILEAMGHTKISEPAPVEKPEPAAETSETKISEVPAVTPPAMPQAKPELATFRLKKGKAFEKKEAPVERARTEKPPRPKKPRPEKKRPEKPEPRERVLSAVAKSRPEDSPFAILEQLKVKKDAS